MTIQMASPVEMYNAHRSRETVADAQVAPVNRAALPDYRVVRCPAGVRVAYSYEGAGTFA